MIRQLLVLYQSAVGSFPTTFCNNKLPACTLRIHNSLLDALVIAGAFPPHALTADTYEGTIRQLATPLLEFETSLGFDENAPGPQSAAESAFRFRHRNCKDKWHAFKHDVVDILTSPDIASYESRLVWMDAEKVTQGEEA